MTLGHPLDVSDYTMTQNDGKRISVQRSYMERDVGIMIDSELNFSEHIHMVSKKANGIMAVIKRTFTCLDCVSTCCTNHWSEHTLNTALQLGFHTKWRTLKLLKKFRNEPQNRLNKSGIWFTLNDSRGKIYQHYIIDDTVVIWLRYIRSCTISMTKKSPQGFWIFQVTHQPEATP